MKVESAAARQSGVARIRRRHAVGVLALLGLAIAVVVAIGFAVLSSERWQAALQEASGAPTRELALRSALNAPANFVRANFSSERAPRLQIDLKFKHLHKLHAKRDAALARGLLEASPDDFVPAGIVTQHGTTDVKLRLAGGDVQHLWGRKWSLLVHVKGDGHVFGMRRFHLLSPELRGYQAETLFLEHLRREDVLAPRYFFVETIFNGKALGLMALEESFAIELLESQERRDGVMLRLQVRPGFALGEAAERSTSGVEILPIRARRVSGSKKLSRNLATATRRLRGYLGGTLPADVVFDTERMGRFLAVVETWGALNALRWEELRFYFNPLTASLEPIGFAGELQRELAERDAGVAALPFARMLLASAEVQRAFLAALRRSEAALRADPNAIAAAEDRWLRILHRSHPLRAPLHAPTAAARAQRIARIDESRLQAITPEDPAAFGRKARRGVIPAESVERNLERHPFLRWDAAAAELSVRKGSWQVDGSILLPKGVGLRIPAGVVLSFEPDEGLIARGPLQFAGTADAPVVLEGPPDRKRKHLWSGVYLMESERPSRWTHVHVRNTGGFRRKGWMLAGGAVFRKTHIEFEHCRFSGNRSDDALNLVRSSFSMKDVEIVDAQSDAFDADYADGSIEGGLMRDANGDGIDLGGSQVRVTGTRLAELRDKAIVVGERSRLDASGLVIEKADIGLASKNGSYALLRRSQMRAIGRVALLAYANRPELGPGVLIAEDNRIEGAARVALAERGSEIVIDGERIASEAISIASLKDLAGSE